MKTAIIKFPAGSNSVATSPATAVSNPHPTQQTAPKLSPPAKPRNPLAALAQSLLLVLPLFAAPAQAREIPLVAPEQAGLSTQKLARIQPFMQGYIDSGKTAGMITVLARNGQIVHSQTYGKMDLESGRPMQTDTIFRIYSMAKPVTAVALMMLYEENKFQLNDPVSKYIPELKGMKVFAGMGKDGPLLENARHEPTIRELLSHSAGFTYGMFGAVDNPVENLYKDADLLNKDLTLQQMVQKLGKLPLAYQPGENWVYSVSSDVAGYLVEVLSGMPLDRFMQERIFAPLEMRDTGFTVPAEKVERFASHYYFAPGSPAKLIDDAQHSDYVKGQRLLSGGGGLVSTARDYLRFAQMLLNGGELYGTRLLSRKTVELMTANHLAPGVTVSLDIPGGKFTIPGYGYGLGFAVMTAPTISGTAASAGEFWWAGAANTEFWVDPQEKLIALVLTQRFPGDLPLHYDMKVFAYQALTD